MSKYKVGDKFVIEIDEAFNNGSFGEKGMLYKVKGFNSLVFDEYGLDKLPRTIGFIHTDDKTEGEKSPAYYAGMKDAWEAARKIACYVEQEGLDDPELFKIFGHSDPADILCLFEAKDAVERIKSFEAEKEKIHVGDELLSKGDKETTVVVTALYTTGEFDAIKISGDSETGKLFAMYSRRSRSNWEKTGKNYDLNKFFLNDGEDEELPYN